MLGDRLYPQHSLDCQVDKMKITNAVIDAYVKCRYKARLILDGQTNEPHDYEVLSDELSESYGARAAEALLVHAKAATASTSLRVTSDDLCRHNESVLLNTTIEAEVFELHFDALIQAKAKSGSAVRVPVLFWHGERLTSEQRLNTAVAASVLGRLQGAELEHALLVSGSTCHVKRIRLQREGVDGVIEELVALAGGQVQPSLRLNKHCNLCCFRLRCESEAEQKGDLSLLKGMPEVEIEKQHGRGIFSIDQLSHTFRPPRKRTHHHHHRRKRQFALQALAIREQKVYLLDTPTLPDPSLRVYVDIEGDSERKHPYLIGVTICNGQSDVNHSLWADSSTNESDLLSDFLKLFPQHDDFTLFHYGSYDVECLRALRTPENLPELDRILGRACNMLSVVYDHVYFPTYTNGLKEIASFLGCFWSCDKASGLQSLVWRHRWLVSQDEQYKRYLLTYNSEDVAALRRVTEFLYALIDKGGVHNDEQAVEGKGPSNRLSVNSVFRVELESPFCVAI